jgi:thiol-disulfide isomerase/thioredoxin
VEAASDLPGDAPPLVVDNKPAILYVGAEYCPYCAAERWPLVMALAKFGAFSGLRATSSSASDINASTPTLTFVKATYTSKYLQFLSVEEYTPQPDASTGFYTQLQTPDRQEAKLITDFDSQGSIPFIYLDGRFEVIGAQYDAGHIAGWKIAQAASYLSSGTNATSLGAEATAAYFVGSICALTRDRPASVCNAVPASLKG